MPARKQARPPPPQQQSSRRPKQRRAAAKRTRNRRGKAIVPGKRYRRTYRLRPCVRPVFFLLALTVLGLERQIGRMFELNDLRSLFYKRNADDFKPQISSVLPWNSTNSAVTCTRPLRRIFDINREKAFKTSNKIPQAVHQFAKEPCLAEKFHLASLKWLFPRWGYYLHSEHSVERLLRHDFPEFPHIKAIGTDCLLGLRLKLSLCKFLVLWMYGGVYVDLNYYPATFSKNSLTSSDDAVLMLETDGKSLSTKFLAVSPRHPIIFLTIQNALYRIHRTDKMITSNAQLEALMQAALTESFIEFRRLAGGSALADLTTIESIVYHGPNGSSLRVVGNGLVLPFTNEEEEKDGYKKMGMGESAVENTNIRCIRAILEKTGSLTQVQVE